MANVGKTEVVSLRMTLEERKSVEEAARRLGVSVAEAARLGVATMAERVAKSGSANNAAEAEFILRQPEWNGYVVRVAGGRLSYDAAIAECGKAIAARLKSEAEVERAQLEEKEKWARVYGRQ